jgi:hypothetical protein
LPVSCYAKTALALKLWKNLHFSSAFGALTSKARPPVFFCL